MSSFLNFIKNCFPYRNIELRSPLTVEEALATLKTNIKPQKVLSKESKDGEFCIYGTITNNNFQITTHTITTKKRTEPVIKGCIVKNDHGSTIRIIMRPSIDYIIFMTIVELSFFGIYLYIATPIIEKFNHGNIDGYTTRTLVIIFLILIIIARLFKHLLGLPSMQRQLQKIKKILCETLDAKEILTK